MPTMQEVRAKYPQYNDMTDEQLASSLHRKFYADMPFEEFASKIGLQREAPQDQDGGLSQVQQQYDALPWYQKAAQAADDTVRLVANGMTLGFADRFAGYMDGTGTEGERKKTQDARERAGTAGYAAEALGTFAPATALAKSALSTTRLVPATWTGAKGVLGRSAGLAGDGATLGTLQALGNDQDPATGAAFGLASGFGGNLLGEALGGATSKVAGMFNKKPPQMTTDQLKSAGSESYKRAKEAGVIFKPEAVDRLRQSVYDDMAEMGFDPALHPGAAVVYNRLERLASGGYTGLDGLDTVRRVASAGYNPSNPANNEMLRSITSRIDDFAASATSDDIISGNAAKATQALSEGRDYWKRFRKLEKVQELIARADRRAASTGSGGNVENATRQELRKILDNKKIMRGFTKDEIAAIEKAVMGTGAQNALRLAGKLSPQGNGLMAALGLGGVASMPMVAVPAMIGGAISKKAAERMASKNADEVMRLVASGGNRATLLGAPNAVQRIAQRSTPLLGRAAMSGALTGGAPVFLVDAQGREYPYP